MNPPNWEGVGQISLHGGPQDEWEEDFEREGRHVCIPPAGISDGGGRTIEGGDLRLLPLEHGRTVYCNHEHYGPVSGGGEETGFKVVQAVVGTGRGGCGGYVDSGLGRGADGGRGGGGYGWKVDGDRLSRW